MDEAKALAKIEESLSAKKKPDPRVLTIWIKENLTPLSLHAHSRISELFEKHLGVKFQLSRPRVEQSLVFEDSFGTLLESIGLEGWLMDYVELTRNMEPPTAFHFWSALTILGAALHRQCWISQGYWRIWPAVQTILIGPSQRVKKGTATSYAVQLGARSGRVYRLMDEGSPEALKSELAARSKQGGATGLIYSAELSTLLGEKDYNKDMVQVLTDLFDSRTGMQRRTVSRGPEHIRDIAVSFLGASNERWLRTAIPASAYEGGFMARVLLIHQLGTNRIIPRPALPSSELEEECLKWLRRTEFVSGEAVLTSDASKFYTEKYHWMKKNWPQDERVAPFWSRMPDHLLRLAMLISISSDVAQRDDIKIQALHIQQAFALLSWILESLPRLYSMLGMNEYGDNALAVIDYLYRRAGTASHAEIARAMLRHMNKRALRETIEMLKDAKFIMTDKRPADDGSEKYILLQGPEAL